MKAITTITFFLYSFSFIAQFGTEQLIRKDYTTDFRIVDLNKDGYNDIIYASGDTIKLLQNNGSGLFIKLNLYSFSLGTYLIETIDLDNDSQKDILFTSYLDKEVKFVKNQGSMSFTGFPQTIINDLDFNQIQTLEVNKEHKTNFIVISSNSDLKTRIYKSDTSNSFTKYPLFYAYPDASKTQSFGYIDNDTNIDIIGNYKYSHIGRPQNSSFFASNYLSLSKSLKYTSLIDFDFDSDPDYFFIDNDVLGYFENNRSANTISTTETIVDTTKLSAFAYGNHSLSNYPFIAAIDNLTHKVSYFENNAGVYSRENLITDTFTRPEIIRVADMDNDGYDDIVVYGGGTGNHKFSWFKNVGQTTTLNKQQTANKFKIYPNPANETIYIVTSLNNFNIKIIDRAGKVVFEKNEVVNKELNISELSKGIYFILVSSSNNNEVFQQKLIKY